MRSRLTQFHQIEHLPLSKIRRQMRMSNEQLLELLMMWESQGLIPGSEKLIQQLQRKININRREGQARGEAAFERFKQYRQQGLTTTEIAEKLGKTADKIIHYNERWYRDLEGEGLTGSLVRQIMNLPEEEFSEVERNFEEKKKLHRASMKRKKTMNALYAQKHIEKIYKELEEPKDYLIFDLEGIQDPDELIEIAVIDFSGKILLDTLVRPSHHVNGHIQRLTGITNPMVKKGMGIRAVMKELKKISDGKILMSWGTDYDKVLLQKASDVTGIKLNCQFICAQKIHMGIKGLPSQIALHKAAGEQTQSHRALDDCDLVRKVLSEDAQAEHVSCVAEES